MAKEIYRKCTMNRVSTKTLQYQYLLIFFGTSTTRTTFSYVALKFIYTVHVPQVPQLYISCVYVHHALLHSTASSELKPFTSNLTWICNAVLHNEEHR